MADPDMLSIEAMDEDVLQMHLRRGELELAVVDFQGAITIAPGEGEAYFWLATVQAIRNETAKTFLIIT
jgi:hypothetical protein